MIGLLLLVTRDRQTQAVCEMVGTLVGFDVRSVTGGRDLLALLRRLKGGPEPASIKIALVDDDLEDMTGYQLIPLMRDQHPDLRIIYTTQTVDPEVELRVRRVGVHCVIDKPVEATLLEKVLRKTVDHETTRMFVGGPRIRAATAKGNSR